MGSDSQYIGTHHIVISLRVAGSWCLVLAVAGGAAWLVTYLARAPQVEIVQAIHSNTTSVAHGTRPVDMPLALLCDFYEHGIEHAPPRDPRGVMQRREDHYRAPPDPFDLMRRQLTASLEDTRLARQICAWQQDWMLGHPAGLKIIGALEQSAAQSSLNTHNLLEVGRAMNFLAGDQVAAAFFRAALAKASREYSALPPGSPEALSLIHELDQTKALWRLGDYPSLELRFRLARRLHPPLSVESRRAGCLLADALFYQDRFDEAADVILAVQAENLRVGDLGALDKSDLPEMEFLQGYLGYCARRFDQAIPHLRRLLGTGEHDQVAARSLFEALLQAGRLDEAQACCDEVAARFHLPASAAAVMNQKLEEARQSSQWRQSISLNGD
jgi:tetratricopeptide (TPR) repeat protein